MPNLKSLFINLHEEEQVDLVMRTLEDLEYLNGLPVERDILDDQEGDESDDLGEDLGEEEEDGGRRVEEGVDTQ